MLRIFFASVKLTRTICMCFCGPSLAQLTSCSGMTQGHLGLPSGSHDDSTISNTAGHSPAPCLFDRGLACEQDTFQVDFVVMDNKSGVFDNKGGQDYSLPLLGASTEQEILDRRAAVHQAAESERLAVSCLALYESPLPCGKP